MVSQAENELITRVGPGTPMGNVLRRYWMPALLAEDLPATDCAPVRVRLLGEDLVAFRDSEGKVGLIEEFCPHRLASLFLGRNEESGLRCVYHGWKFDTAGNCVDMPSEPATSSFKERIHITSYPTAELGGVIWTYMGPPEKRPELPGMEWLRAPEEARNVSKTLEYANFVQAIEGGIDTVHSNFLHGGLPPARRGEQRNRLRQGTAPELEVERTPYGFRYAGIYPRTRDDGVEEQYVRMYQFIMPFHQFRAQEAAARRGDADVPVPQVRGHMWVPIDDENTWIFNWMYASDPERPFTPEMKQAYETQAGRGPDGETGNVRRRVRDNDWLIDREMQRLVNFIGIPGTNSQDLAVQESMGPIVDRSREHLGSTDKAIVTMRLMLLDAIKKVANGDEPPGLEPDTYRHVKASDAVLPRTARWQEAAEELLVARR
jgi:phthalate 4,5-dioxygenase